MGDMAEVFREYNAYKKDRRQKLGMTCPDCAVRLPKTHPKILMPGQRCWCGYVDKRPREAALRSKNHE
jgi:hypothetical protein